MLAEQLIFYEIASFIQKTGLGIEISL